MTTELFPSGSGGVLGREALQALIDASRPLVSGFLSLEEQLQPNGFDLSLAEIGRFAGTASIGRSNAHRVLPEVEALPFADDGWIELPPGSYQLVFNEVVDLPNDLMALGRPRSSLCRGGATVVTAVWDAGYRGRSTALLTVLNPQGLRIERDARLVQLVFFTLVAPTERGYAGIYQNERVEPHPSR
jgi:dUTP pyrophosphatase